MFRIWLESSLSDLYDSAVDAFPNTTMRQHAIGPIQIHELSFTPFIGVKTLFLRGTAFNENRQYSPIILFKNVVYSNEGDNLIDIVASDGLHYRLKKLSVNENNVLLRCGCKDFFWRFNYYNHLDKSLFGRKRTSYESQGLRGPINPMEMPGMCKHLMKLIETLKDAKLIK